jgi:Rrf2 family protein
MIKLSRREDYAVILVNALMQAYKKRLVPLSEVAKDYELSLLFLRNLAGDLRHAGIIKAVEGKNGGYFLARDPKEIKMGDVLRIFSKEQAFMCCSKNKHGACPKENHCAAENVWRKLNKELIEKVYSLSIKEFLQQTNT